MSKLQLPADVDTRRTSRYIARAYRWLFGWYPDPPEPKKIGRILTEEHGLPLTDEHGRELIY